VEDTKPSFTNDIVPSVPVRVKRASTSAVAEPVIPTMAYAFLLYPSYHNNL